MALGADMPGGPSMSSDTTLSSSTVSLLGKSLSFTPYTFTGFAWALPASAWLPLFLCFPIPSHVPILSHAYKW